MNESEVQHERVINLISASLESVYNHVIYQ